MKGKLGKYKLNDLIFGLIMIGCGTLLFTHSSALSFAIRTIIGFWVLFSGINKIILAISIKPFDNTGFKVYLITALLMVVIGICLLSGLVDKIIGLFIIGYSVIEMVNYIYYIVKNKDYGVTESKVQKNSKIKNKRLKAPKVVDAIIEEEKN